MPCPGGMWCSGSSCLSRCPCSCPACSGVSPPNWFSSSVGRVLLFRKAPKYVLFAEFSWINKYRHFCPDLCSLGRVSPKCRAHKTLQQPEQPRFHVQRHLGTLLSGLLLPTAADLGLTRDPEASELLPPGAEGPGKGWKSCAINASIHKSHAGPPPRSKPLGSQAAMLQWLSRINLLGFSVWASRFAGQQGHISERGGVATAFAIVSRVSRWLLFTLKPVPWLCSC